ncbi:unnamed protein product [Adineta ricciae]|uniref:Transposase n=1 Tax=Adineta ricciae TaxID=249248 RepID=A0A813NC85_ADIRI|nr:unnamed protein product [Adineta ricciae]CAF1641962.1 unnamed protein product [Adineta ricciae]
MQKKKIRFDRKRPAATPSTVLKVIQQIDVEDPLTQRSTAQSCHISHSTVSRSIKSTNFVLRKKRKAQKLSSLNIEKRYQRAYRLYRRSAIYRYENFVTNGTEGKAKVCYVKKTDPDYEGMIIQQDSSRPKAFMVRAGISSHGKTSIHFVDSGTKINSDYYINHILRPFLFPDRPRLFPDTDKKKMVFHHHNAPSHT